MPKLKLHWWVLLAILLGAVVGTVLNRLYYPEIRAEARSVVFQGQPYDAGMEAARMKDIQREEQRLFRLEPWGGAIDGVARLFLTSLKMIVLPLVVSSLISGILGLGDFRKLGRMGGKSLAWIVVTGLLAILTGLFLVNVIRPGVGVALQLPTTATEPTLPDTFWDLLLSMVPDNVIGAAAQGNLIQVLFFTVLFGIFALKAEERHRRPVAEFFNGLFEIMMSLTMFIISLAPVGIAALIASLVAVTGPEVFSGLVPYALTVALALAIHFFLTLPVLFWVITRRNPYRLMKAMSAALFTAFSTASSSGTLPVTLERLEHGAGVSNRVSSFVLPIGATMNMNGTALYECVAVIFVSQLYASVNPDFSLSFATQVTIVALSLMVSIGAAGIPHAGLVMMVIIFKAIGVPIELAGVLWAVDRPLDMARTAVNVWSDAVGAAAIASTENEIDDTVLFAR